MRRKDLLRMQPRPRPGSLPLPKREELTEPSPIAVAVQSAPPPWASIAAAMVEAHQASAEPPLEQRQPRPVPPVSKLRAARRKAEELGAVLRDEAFNDWVRRSLSEAARPDEWSQSRELYESYVKHATRYGDSRSARGLSRQVMATETWFGKMMGSLFPKVRRARGYFYPVRLKRGA